MNNSEKMSKAKSLISAGEHNQALKYLSSFPLNHRNGIEYLTLRAHVLTNLGAYEDAKKDLNTALAIEPTFIDALKARSHVRDLLSDHDGAWQDCHRVLIKDPSCKSTNRRVISLAERMGLNDDLSRHFEVLLENQAGTLDDYLAFGRYINRRTGNGTISTIAEHARKNGGDLESKFSLAVTLHDLGYILIAIQLYKEIASEHPQIPEPLNNQANALALIGEDESAIQTFNLMLQAFPDFSDGYVSVGNFFSSRGDFNSAEKYFIGALERNSQNIAAAYNLGNCYQELGNYSKAVQCYQQAIEVNPQFAGAYNNLGNVYKALGKTGLAIDSFEKAQKLSENDATIFSNLGAVYCDSAQFDKARKAYETALSIEPENTSAISNYLYFLSYLPNVDDTFIKNEHQRLCQVYSREENTPGTGAIPVAKNKIRVGYVSPDFRLHSVSFFFQPLIENHDRQQFEVYCYSTSSYFDHVSEQIKRSADCWRSAWSLSEEALARQIQEDQIDVLVDLAGHTSGNKIATFAYTPAPVQISWLGYPNTTGLKDIRFRFTDSIADPIGITDEHHTEELIRLEGGFLCYRGDKSLPIYKAPPLIENGQITFGSFNNITKISSDVVRVWSRVLKTIPNSNLIVKSKLFADETVRENFLSHFLDEGVALKQLVLLGHVNNYSEHMNVYQQVDIALDTFPYNGTTTTCEALWMGVPVITLVQGNHRSQVSASILSRINKHEWVANSDDEFIAIAEKLAGSVPHLSDCRVNLRNEMLNSDLCDERRYSKAIEQGIMAAVSATKR